MSEQSLTDLLERLAQRSPVGPPPTQRMVARVRRRQRRMVALAVAATVAAVTTVGGATPLGGPRSAVDRDGSAPIADRAVDPTPTSPTQSASTPVANGIGPTPLDGTWRLNALVGEDSKSVLPRTTPPIDIVIENGQVATSTACGDITATVQTYNEATRSIVYTGTETSPTYGCVDAPPIVERLDAVRHFNRADEDTLTLHAENWMIVFDLRLVAPATNGAPTAATNACISLPPSELPNGDPVGPTHETVTASGQETVRQSSWGRGANAVYQQSGNPLEIPRDVSPNQTAKLRDTTIAYVIPIGDPGQIAFVFTIDGCTYTNWIGPGIDMTAAVDYIARY